RFPCEGLYGAARCVVSDSRLRFALALDPCATHHPLPRGTRHHLRNPVPPPSARAPPAATMPPSGDHASDSTRPATLSVSTSCFSARFHNLTVLSALPLATVVPSGETARQLMPLRCPPGSSSTLSL